MINQGWTPPILRIVRLFVMDCREGERDPLAHDRGRPVSVRPVAAPYPRARRPAMRAGHRACSGTQVPLPARRLSWRKTSFRRVDARFPVPAIGCRPSLVRGSGH